MKMITKEIEKKFAKYPLYSQDGKGNDAVVICKVFNPYGSQSWYILEAGKVEANGDREIYVYETSCGEGWYHYMMLSDLTNTMVNFHGCRLPFERDMWFSGNLADAKRDAYVA